MFPRSPSWLEDVRLKSKIEICLILLPVSLATQLNCPITDALSIKFTELNQI